MNLKDGALLISGHSYQTEEPAITITMNGYKTNKSNKFLAFEGNLIYLSKIFRNRISVGSLLSKF